MYYQYWCPLQQAVVGGNADSVWWDFHEDCNRDYHHRQIEAEHVVTMEIWPLDEPDYIYYVARCACGFVSEKQAVERAAELLWWKHYNRRKSPGQRGVDMG